MSTKNEKARPFLKWAGGKKQVIDCIENIFPQELKDSEITYYEPFLGGGAVFFHLISIEDLDITEVFLGDINSDLILTWNVVKDDSKKLISKLKTFSKEFIPLSQECRKEFYYNIREEFNNNLDDFDDENSNERILRASQFIFLNRTCYNGLYRVNKAGKFNVPIGTYKNPLICDKDNLLKVSKVLKGVNIKCGDYNESNGDWIDKNSFFYLDPPYLPIKKNSFTSYSSNNFGVKEQIELSKFCESINKKGAKFILSNSDPQNHDPNNTFFKDVYGKLDLDCDYKRVNVRRAINSNGNKRGPIKELLIFNY